MSLARDIADLGSVTARLDTVGGSSGSLGVGRNVLTNGAMNVAQRSTSVTGIGASAGYFTCDRWKTLVGGDATAGRLTMSQETTDVPSGFTHAMKLACTTADTSIAANELFGIVQHIEAGTCARSQFGTSDAKEITVSFYAKADSNKTYSVMILNNKNSSFVHNNRTFNVTTSWQRFTMTFQADTTADSKFDGTLTDAGFSLSFLLHAGSGYTSATLASDWAAGVTNRAAGTQSIFSATSNTFFFTGVQLEVGSQSTDFEHRSFGDQLQACQRYFQTQCGTTTNDVIAAGFTSTANFFGYGKLNKTMRAAPTASVSGTNSDISYTHVAVAAAASGAPSFTTNLNSFFINIPSGTTTTANAGAYARSTSTSTKLHFDAEL